jgi:hypothetical protein
MTKSNAAVAADWYRAGLARVLWQAETRVMEPESNHVTTWDEFTARQTRETGAAESIQPPPRREAKESSLSAVLMQAIHVAGARRGRISRAARIRELTLLEVLSETMRRR